MSLDSSLLGASVFLWKSWWNLDRTQIPGVEFESLPTICAMFFHCFLCSWVPVSLVQAWIRPRVKLQPFCTVLRTPNMLKVVWCSVTLLSSEGDAVGDLVASHPDFSRLHCLPTPDALPNEPSLSLSSLTPSVSLIEAPMTAQNHLKRSPFSTTPPRPHAHTHTNKE